MKLYHFFPDLMNLYGDYGNLVALKNALTAAGETAEVVPVRPGHVPDLSDADFLYMGPGTEPARNAALAHLRPWTDALRDALLEKDVPALFTGNAWSLLGQTLTLAGGETLDGLGLFPYATVETRDRYTGDAIARPAPDAPLPPLPCVGFLNRCDTVYGVDTPLFTMDMGRGNDGNAAEGFVHGKFYATHLIGPLLVKDPHLLDHFLSLLGLSPIPGNGESPSSLAYQVTLNALRARLTHDR